MSQIIAIANQKGGVGKTTTSMNLAASLGVLEKKTLLIDADPQANATSGVGHNPKEVKQGIYECLIKNINPRDCILKTTSPNLDLIPSSIDLVGAELDLVNLKEREYKMRHSLNSIKNEYDYIIIDCAPSLGLLTLNALSAADSVIIPIPVSYTHLTLPTKA